jgi:hypothetical protein
MRVHKTNTESMDLLQQSAKVFTAEGMSGVKRTMGNAAVMSSTQKFGSDGLWYRDAASYIQSRSQYDLEQLKDEGLDHHRASRHILSIFAKALPYVAPMIWDAVKGMFVSDGTILESLAAIRSAIPKEFKGFTDIPVIVSEVIALLRRKMGNTDQYEKDFSAIELGVMDAIKRSHNASLMESVMISQVLMEEAVLSQYTLWFTLHYSTLQDCRENRVPLSIAPPKVLEARIKQVEATLDPGLELVYGSNDIGMYYTSHSARCKFDSDGGVLGVRVLIRPSKSNFALFELKTFAFAWNNYTCDIGIPTGLVVQDITSGSVYPVTQLDEEDCQLESSTTCKLPEVCTNV